MDGGQVPVFLAVGSVLEPRLLAVLQSPRCGLVAARRCEDLADLLASAATGLARCAVLSGDLPGLDREAVLRLAASGVATVAVVPTRDEPAERRLRQLGLQHVLPLDSPAAELVAAVRSAVSAAAGAPARAAGYADPSAALHALFAPGPESPGAAGAGRVVAVWGPTGAPGRTTVAVTLAAELAALGWPALLVDADVYGGTAAASLGLPDESSGLAAACRLANSGTLDVPGLAALGQPQSPGLQVLTGLDRADRWAELRPGSVQTVLDLARALAAVTVVDCGFCLEQDEELS